MLPQDFPKLSAKEQAALGMPEGLKFFTPAQLEGLNQSDSRIGMPDNELFYLENLIHIGAYNLRTLWDVGTALYTAPNGKTIVSFFFYSIGTSNYAVVFLDDGTAIQINSSTKVNTTISSTANTFYDSSISTQLPACTQWGAKYLIIANNNNSNDYWLWDSSVLFKSGGIAPQVSITNSGGAYAVAPSVTAFGGMGSGATFTATVSAGNITNIKVTNPGSGYVSSDVVQLAFGSGSVSAGISAQLKAVLTATSVNGIVPLAGGSGYTSPSVSITGGGGSSATATATVVGGIITAINMTANGSGYTSTPTVTITDSTGSGALVQVFLSPTSVASVSIVNGGSGFPSAPTLSFSGGGGTGATATCTVSGTSINAVTVGVGGNGYTSVPGVIVQSGVNNAAVATVTLMPFGISGSSLETFSSHVWSAFPNSSTQKMTQGNNNGDIFLFSAPESVTDFSTGNGGGSYASSDSFLRYQYTNIKQSNGYLYPIADSSVSVVSNVQTSGNPSTTTFSYQNTDPQVGTVWRDSCQDFSRTVLLANPLGIWGLYGGAVTKISKKLDTLFSNALFPPTAIALLPSAAVANIFSRRFYCLLMTFQDPFSLKNVNKMVCWDEKNFFIASQTPDLTYIGTQEINSNLTAWGTDGTSLYPLFNTPSSSLQKKVATKLYGVNSPVIRRQAYTFAIMAQDLSTAQSGLTFNVNIDTNYLNPETGSSTYALPAITLNAPQPTYPLYTTSEVADVYGMNIGVTLSSTSADFTINFMGLGYIDYVAELSLAGG